MVSYLSNEKAHSFPIIVAVEKIGDINDLQRLPGDHLEGRLEGVHGVTDTYVQHLVKITDIHALVMKYASESH